MFRLFVALELPRDLRANIAALQEGIPGARWVPPENYHLTLRFIGEVEGWQAEEVDSALAAIRTRRFDLVLRGIGLHEKAGRIQSLWIGAEKSDALTHLQSKIETALQRCGMVADRRRFAPHVTIARTERAAPEKLAGFVQAHNLFRAAPVAVEGFTLFSSRLGKEASVYEAEVEYELA